MRNLININEILGKYFVGEELTEAELMELENYKSANNNEFIALKKTMTQTKTATADFNIDIEESRRQTARPPRKGKSCSTTENIIGCSIAFATRWYRNLCVSKIFH